MIGRRSFVIGIGLGLSVRASARAETSLHPLWPGVPPGNGGPSGAVEVGRHGAIGNIAVPTLEIFTPDHPNGAAMLVAGGGGYKRIEMDTEARPAAHWLAARGITAFVLTYRLPTEGWHDGSLVPLQDAQRALRLVRAYGRGIDPARIGVLGFSAGGHLMGLAATRPDFASYAPIDAIDTLSARPAVAALIYPVITLRPPYDHTSTRRSLIGDRPDSASSAAWSVDTYVRRGDPPMFLMQADDDPVSDPANSRIMADACRRAGIPVELHTVESGGHGFGMGRPGTPTMAWPGWYDAWLRRSGLLPG